MYLTCGIGKLISQNFFNFHYRKYKDTNLLGQADDYGNEGALDNSPPIGAQSQPVTMVAQEDSEEELDTGEIRRSVWSPSG